MTDPVQWSAAEKEERLKRLFANAQQLIGEEGRGGYMEVAFENDPHVYQYMPGCHNISEMDSEMAAAMADIIERYDLDVTASGSDRSTLERFISSLKRVFSRESVSADVAWITACHGHVESADDAYTVFIDICETVYRCSLSDVTAATIALNTGDSPLSWTDV